VSDFTRWQYARAFAVVAILVASAFLGGCGEQSDLFETTPGFEVKAHRYRGSVYAYELRLDDGTRCVRTPGGGIDCDFAGEQR
jgi:hypothetical protein